MSDKMNDEEIDKIARAIAAKIGEPGGPAILGCGDASSSQSYTCNNNFVCNSGIYECGGAGPFRCTPGFSCTTFRCYSDFGCGNPSGFSCPSNYNP
jgi:hypothetical protein